MAAPGLHYQDKQKMNAKRNPEVEEKLKAWIGAVIGEELPKDRPIEDLIYDGTTLCKLMNKLDPKANIKYYISLEKFKMMENCSKFDAAAVNYGVKRDDLFRSVDLVEKKNTPEVIGGIIALARQAVKKGFQGPQPDPSIFAL